MRRINDLTLCVGVPFKHIDPLHLAAAGVGLFGSLGGSIIQSNANKEINRQNIAMQRETNELTRSMFDENLAWQRESQDKQNEYNSLMSQIQRAIEAGVSPASLFESSVGSTPASTGSTGSAIPSFTSPHANFVDEPLTAMMFNLGTLSKAYSDIKQGGLSGAQSKAITEKLSVEIDKLLSEKDNITADTLAKDIQNNLNRIFGYDERKEKLNLVRSNICESLAKSEMYRRQGDLFDAQKWLAFAEEELTKSKTRISDKEYEYLDEYLTLRNSNLSKDIQVKNSQIGYNQAMRTRALTESDDIIATRESRIDLAEAQASLARSQRDLNYTRNSFEKQTLQTRIYQEVEKLSQSEYLTQTMRYDMETAKANMEQAMYANDMKKFTYWSNFAKGLLDSAIDAFGKVVGSPFMPHTSEVNVHGDSYDEVAVPGKLYYDLETGEPGQYPNHKQRKYYPRNGK